MQFVTRDANRDFSSLFYFLSFNIIFVAYATTPQAPWEPIIVQKM